MTNTEKIVVDYIEFELEPSAVEDETLVGITNLQLRQDGDHDGGYLGHVPLSALRMLVAATGKDGPLDAPSREPRSMFTYTYYARELATFLRLLRDPESSWEDLDRAWLGLGHLYINTEEPEKDLDRINLRKSFEIAGRRYIDRVVAAAGSGTAEAAR